MKSHSLAIFVGPRLDLRQRAYATGEIKQICSFLPVNIFILRNNDIRVISLKPSRYRKAYVKFFGAKLPLWFVRQSVFEKKILLLDSSSFYLFEYFWDTFRMFSLNLATFNSLVANLVWVVQIKIDWSLRNSPKDVLTSNILKKRQSRVAI